jgi:hypothetical protein
MQAMAATLVVEMLAVEATLVVEMLTLRPR